jgi:hypothetical protein
VLGFLDVSMSFWGKWCLYLSWGLICGKATSVPISVDYYIPLMLRMRVGKTGRDAECPLRACLFFAFAGPASLPNVSSLLDKTHCGRPDRRFCFLEKQMQTRPRHDSGSEQSACRGGLEIYERRAFQAHRNTLNHIALE